MSSVKSHRLERPDSSHIGSCCDGILVVAVAVVVIVVVGFCEGSGCGEVRWRAQRPAPSTL